jgi:hypothetical protein
MLRSLDFSAIRKAENQNKQVIAAANCCAAQTPDAKLAFPQAWDKSGLNSFDLSSPVVCL